MTNNNITRQPDDVIAQAEAARDAAQYDRDRAKDRRDEAAHLLAYAALNDHPSIPEEWKDAFRTAEHDLETAREAHHAARVAWYHALGKHAHSDLKHCCQPAASD